MSEMVSGVYRERISPDAAVAAADATTERGATAVRRKARAGSVVFERVGKTYRSASGDVEALSNIDVAVRPGGIFGIIGRSGAGKSSLIRLVNRLETPTTGRVLLDGRDIAAFDSEALIELRRRIGMVFQHFNLMSAKTVRENVALPLLVAGVPRTAIARRVDEVLALVGLEDKHDVYPARLSGGQKQRVGIARALVSEPEILLCDEATSALDPETTLSILRLLKDINRRLGLTIVLITHEMSVIREICAEVLVLDGGRIAETGPVWRVFGYPGHEATRALLRPLTRGLPEDIAGRLRPAPSGRAGEEAVVELAFANGGEPDIAALSAFFGGSVRLLSASVDRIDGHTQGQLLLAANGFPDESALARGSWPFTRGKVLGYV